MFLDNFPIKQKLLFVIIILTLFASFFLFMFIYGYYQTYNQAKFINSLTQVSIASNKLVHELQKERGLTAGYLASGKQKFVQELKDQRILSNSKSNDLSKYLDQSNKELKEYFVKLNIDGFLSKIDNLRSSIDQNQLNALEAIGTYTQIIGSLIELNRLNMDKASKFDNLYELTKSLYNFTQIKENYGQLRANINRIATTDSVDFGGSQNVSRLYHNNNLLKSEFDYYAYDKYKLPYDELNQKEMFNYISSTINKILTNLNKKGLSIPPEQWFETCTNYINELAEIENSFAIDILELSNTLEKNNFSNFLTYLIITIILLITIVWISFFLIYQITRNLEIARKLSEKLSNGIL